MIPHFIIDKLQTGSLVPLSISEAGFMGIRESNQDIEMPVSNILVFYKNGARGITFQFVLELLQYLILDFITY